MRCHRCSGMGWEEVEDGAVKPCPVCNRELYDRWARGDFTPRFAGRPLSPEPPKAFQDLKTQLAPNGEGAVDG